MSLQDRFDALNLTGIIKVNKGFDDCDETTAPGVTPLFTPEEWEEINRAFQGVGKKCECGSAAVGSNYHSSWCPLYKKG